MRNLVLLPVIMVAASLGGCVSETVHFSQGRESGERVFAPAEAALTRMNLGLEYLRLGDTGQAKFNLERALTQDPRNPDIHLALAYFYQSVAEYGKAEQSYRQVLKLAPEHGDGLNNYGAFLCQRERFDEADVMFRKAVAVLGYVKVADSFENAALCALDGGRDEDALEYFRRALDYAPNRPRSLLGLASGLMERGNAAAAESLIARYRQRHSPSPVSLWLTVRTAKARGDMAQARQAGAELVRLFPDTEQAERYLTDDY